MTSPTQLGGLDEVDQPAAIDVERGFAIVTGIECSAPTIAGGRRVDELEKTGHYDRMEEDLALVRATGFRHLRYGIPFHIANPAPGVFDWTFTDRAMARCQELGIVPFVDLLHFGVPDDVGDFQNPGLPERFEVFARAFAGRFPWVRHYTPVNEPLITAMWSARLGYWNERARDERAFVRALVNVARCAVLATQAIREIRPEAVFIQSETCHYYHPRRVAEIEAANFENELRFAPFELVYGRRLPGVVADHLIANGIGREELAWFERNGSDEGAIAGNDYYAESEQFVSADRSMLGAGVRLGYYHLAHQYHERLGVPIMHTETNMAGEGQVEWLLEQWTDIVRLRREGFPIRGFTWYGFVNHVDWDSSLTEDRGVENACGLVGLDRTPNPAHPVIADLLAEVAAEAAT